MTLKIRSGLLLLAYFGPACVGALAADFHVHPGASGAGTGLDWENALTALPDSLNRGDTYYLADGTCPGYVFDDPEVADVPITVMKATATDHGSDTGWQAELGNGTATFTGGLHFQSGFWILDGQLGGGPGHWLNGHGFEVFNSLWHDFPEPDRYMVPPQGDTRHCTFFDVDFSIALPEGEGVVMTSEKLEREGSHLSDPRLAHANLFAFFTSTIVPRPTESNA
ncbi:MAG: hypothetical protein GY906_14020 [bacterium]|nr:hypothetical protein [bacterium]